MAEVGVRFFSFSGSVYKPWRVPGLRGNSPSRVGKSTHLGAGLYGKNCQILPFPDH